MTALTGGGILDDRLRAVGARGRVRESLLGVALDVIEPYASDYLTADEYSRMCDVLRRPVDVATDVALGALVDALALTLKADDSALAARLEIIRRRAL